MEILGHYLLVLLVKCAWGTICSEMATARNRNFMIAFCLGWIFGLFAVIGYAIAGEKESENE